MEKEKYIDKSEDKKYFAIIPYYIVNHSSAYEQSLYLVMKRIASEEGTCWASAITIGKIMKVSPNTVRKYRDKLLKRNWVKVVGSRGKTKPTNEFEIVDLWKLNMDYYSKKESSTIEQSKKESSTGEKKVQLVSLESSTGGNKEETIKKKQEEDIATPTGVAVDINFLIKLFEPINPSYERLFANTTQRAALARLIDKFDYEKVGAMIKALSQIINRPFAPKVITPLELERDLGKIKAFIAQEKGRQSKKIEII